MNKKCIGIEHTIDKIDNIIRKKNDFERNAQNQNHFFILKGNFLRRNKNMAKTEAQKERHKRWLKRHPDYIIKSLKKWVNREKDPEKLESAKALLEKHIKKGLTRKEI